MKLGIACRESPCYQWDSPIETPAISFKFLESSTPDIDDALSEETMRELPDDNSSDVVIGVKP